MRKYEQHPLSAAFPQMGDGDFMLLCHDIREHGLRDAGVLHDGMVLDGWHRYRACAKERVEFLATEYTGNDPAAYVLSVNRHRRHLTISQIGVAIVRCKAWRPASVRGDPGSPMETVAEMAEEAEISERTIQRSKVAVEAGLGDAVRDGMMSVKDAVHVARGTTPKASARTPETERSGAGAPSPVEPSASLAPADQLAEDAHGGTDPLDHMEDLLRENEALRAINVKLSASDLGAELAKAVAAQKYAQTEQGKAMDQAAYFQRELKSWQAWWAKVVAASKIEKRSEVLAWIKARL